MLGEESHVVELLSASNLVAGLLTYVLIAVIVATFRAPRYPTSIPWVGYGKGWLAAVRNRVLGFSKAEEWINEGYQNYSKNGKAYVLPGSFGVRSEIIIPRSQMQWMLDQPDSILSSSEAHMDMLNGDYSFVDQNVLKDPYHEHVIYKNLARNLNTVIPELSDETAFVIDRAFGEDTMQWKNVNLLNTLFSVIPKLTNRMLVGKPLCRNQDYLDNCIAFTMDVIRNLVLFSVTPKPLKFMIGPFASLPAKYHFYKASKYTFPVIQERLDLLKRIDSGEEKTRQEPNDYLTWHIRTGQSEGRPDMLTVKRIAKGIFPLNFASIHTTSITAHNVILDIYSTDPSLGVVEALREEVETVFEEDQREWTKAGLGRLYKMDSAIRESMRRRTIGHTLIIRKVTAPEGITNPVEGWHAPRGTFMSCSLNAVHLDEELHPNAQAYDPFRYSREREEYEKRPAENKNSKEALRIRGTGMVTTSDSHFPFGHGRHTCPGRFFVAHELKMVLAYMLMNYDVKPLEKRPESVWIGRNVMPPTEACIEVRRKAKH